MNMSDDEFGINEPDNITTYNISSYAEKDELEKLKHQLFMENVRIQTERSQIEADFDDIRHQRHTVIIEKKQLEREKRQLVIEMGELKEQAEYERKRLKEEEKLLERKQKVVERSYEILDTDRKHIQAEYQKIEQEKARLKRMTSEARKEVYATGIFFRGVNNQVSLKKRYKDLLKIYHPDNLCGDNEILLKINQEYEELRSRMGFGSGVI